MAARDVAIVIKARDEASKTFEGVSSRLGGLAKAAKFASVAGIAGVAAIGGIAAKLAIDAAKVEQTRATFDKLAQSVGGTLPTALEKLRKATRGMVSDADLMLAGNKFLAMGLADTEDKAADLAQMATQLGMAMGEDATASMENFALMMANQSIPRLDSFGISSSKVRERILELMAADKAMTREMAFSQAVMEQGAITMEKVGEQGEGTAAQMAQFRTVLSNLKLELGRAFLPILTKVMKALIPMATLLARKLVPWTQKFAKILENLIWRVGKRVKPFVEAIQGIGEAFEWLRMGDTEAFLERLWFALEEAFGVRIADAVYQFMDMITGVANAFKYLRAGDFPAFLDRLKYALANVFGRDMARRFTEFIGMTSEVAIVMKTRFATPIAEAFGQAKAAALDWWEGEGGGKGILQEAEKSWAAILGDIVSHTESFASDVAEKLQPILSSLEEKAAPVVEALGPLVKRLSELRQVLAESLPAGGLMGALETLEGLPSKIGEKLEPVVAKIQGHSDEIQVILAVVATAIATAILTNILGPVGLIVGAVKITKVAWDKNWFGMRDTIKDVIDTEILPRLEKLRINLKGGGIDIEGILIRLRKRFAELKPMGREVWGTMQEKWEGFWKSFKQAAKPFTDRIAEWTSAEFLPRLPKLFDAATKFGEELAKTIEKMTKEISEFLKKHPGVKEFLQKMIDLIGLLVGSTLMGLLDLHLRTITMLLDSFIFALNAASWILQYVVQPAISGVIRFFDRLLSGINLVIGAIRSLREKLSLPFSLPRLPSLSGVGSLLGFEAGGIVPGPVGRPQLVMAHGGERIVPASKSSGMTFDFRGAQFYGVTQDFVEDLFKEHELIRELQGVRGRNP